MNGVTTLLVPHAPQSLLFQLLLDLVDLLRQKVVVLLLHITSIHQTRAIQFQSMQCSYIFIYFYYYHYVEDKL